MLGSPRSGLWGVAVPSPQIRASNDGALQVGCHHRNLRPSVLIVDDHAGFRASARALLEADGFDVVGEAANAAEALRAAARLRPRVVLLDIQLPDVDGIAVARLLAGTGSAVVLISSRETVARDPRMAATPARGFLPKSRLSGEALAAVLG
jgi:DNA-binding NarL/FixJ family response regulator